MRGIGPVLAAALGVVAALGSHAHAARHGTGLAASPDTTGAALWAYITTHHYEHWSLWPGKGRFFKGESPHGDLLTVYVDSLAYEALAGGAAAMPARAIIVKENYDADRKLLSHTVMYKVPGYSPEHHDWFWGWYDPDGTIVAAGRAQACYQCHDIAAQYDELWMLRDQHYLKGQRR